MKQLFWLVCASVAFAGGPNLKTSDLDLGTKVKGQEVQATVNFTNNGDQPLVIDEVKTPCGCTKVTLDKKTYAPGESGSFDVTIKTARLTGAYDKTLVMVSNDVDNPKQRVRLRFDLSDEAPAAVD